VVAIELDALLARELTAGPNVTVVNADILKVDPADHFKAPYAVVANLPYHITSPALRHLLAAGPPFVDRLVVMLQSEVAERITAQPGGMSALAVAIQAQARATIIRRVPAAAFYPRPRVDSAVVLLEPLGDEARAIQRTEVAEFTALVQAGFKQPRKTLANSLAEGLTTSKVEVIDALVKAGIDPTKRPQALAVEDWVRLFRCSTAVMPMSS
jgi:16S rRNA (adenine1518-N6/adenine1519-N6)-dimethyltransferase